MKALTFLLCMQVFCTFSFGQTIYNITDPQVQEKSAAKAIQQKPGFFRGSPLAKRTLLTEKSLTAFWSENFSQGVLPAGWSVVDSTGNNFNWIVTNLPPGGNYSVDSTCTFYSSSGGYFISLPSDFYNTPVPWTGSPTTIAMNAYIQTPAIDCSEKNSVIIEFEEYFRYCCSATTSHLSLFISNDNINWTEFDVKNGVGVNARSDNPLHIQLNISSVAANQPTVYLRWHENGASHYFWMIDDIKLSEAPDNDLVLMDSWPIFEGDGFYSKIPKSEIQPVTFHSKIYNMGNNTQNGVSLNVKITDYYGTVYDQTDVSPDSIQSDDYDSLSLSTPFIPGHERKEYSIIFNVSSDSTDESPADNADTITMAVTDSVYARDYIRSTTAGPCNYVGSSDGDFVGNNFFLFSGEEVNSVSVFITANSFPGAMLIGKILKWDSLSSMWLEMIGTDIFNVNQNNLGAWVTIPFLKDGSSEFLTSGATYCVGVECYWQGIGGNIYFGGDNVGPHDYQNSSLLRLGFDWYNVNVIPLIRLNVMASTDNTFLSGVVYFDENENGIKDGNEYGLASQLVKIYENNMVCGFSATNADGDFHTSLNYGNYTFVFNPPLNWYFTSDSIYSISLSDSNSVVSNLNYGIHPNANIINVAAYLTAEEARCGFQTNTWLNYRNYGTQNQSGTITMNYDTNLVFISSNPTVVNHTGNTLQWNYTNLLVGQQGQIHLIFQIPDFNFMGETLTSVVRIDPVSGDAESINNFDTLQQVVVCSWDPNDKAVSPQGITTHGYTLFGQKLTYTIRFQNTGNAEAYTVEIKDTLDCDFNIESFSLIASSHPVEFEIEGAGVVIFTFNNIMLPDSNTDEPGSNGFVKFSIEPKDSLVENTIAKNIAYIFFDFNPAVVTNEVTNTYVSVLPPLVKIVETESPNDNVMVFPNPFSSTTTIVFPNKEKSNYRLTVYDITGQTVRTIENIKTGRVEFSRQNLSLGLYYFRLSGSDGVCHSGKMIVE